MGQEEGKMIAKVDVEKNSQGAKKPKTKLAILYTEELVYFLWGSSHAHSINSHIFNDTYSFCRDATMPDTNLRSFFGIPTSIGLESYQFSTLGLRT